MKISARELLLAVSVMTFGVYDTLTTLTMGLREGSFAYEANILMGFVLDALGPAWFIIIKNLTILAVLLAVYYAGIYYRPVSAASLCILTTFAAMGLFVTLSNMSFLLFKSSIFLPGMNAAQVMMTMLMAGLVASILMGYQDRASKKNRLDSYDKSLER